jgi:hypothetical protein
MKAMDVLRTVLIGSIAIIMALPGSFVVRSGGLSFEDNLAITNDTWDHKNPDIGISDNGTVVKVFMVYEDYESLSTPHILFMRSSNGGQTFNYSFDLYPYNTTDSKIWNPSMDNIGDKIVVVFLDNYFASVYPAEAVITAAISEDAGITWNYTYVTDIYLPDPSITDPYVDIDPDGNIFVVWKQEGDAMITYSEDFGKTWHTPTWVLEWTNPNDPNGQQKYPTVACDGSHIVVAVEGLPDFKAVVYYTSSPMPVSGSFGFGTWTRMTYYEYTNYNSESRRPIVVTDGSAFHMICWDFQSDKNHAYESEDTLTNDRAAVSYSRSTDGGATFSIGGNKSIYVNKTTDPLAWHSAGSIYVMSGKVYVTWIDYTQGSPNKGAVWVSSSSDGLNWSGPDRVTPYSTTRVVKEDPQVAADTNGDAYVAWVSKGDFSSPGNINFGRSGPNKAPSPVTGLMWFADMDLPETKGTVTWTINQDPDFKEYRIYLGNKSGFALGSPIFNTTVQGSDLHDISDLTPDTQYYLVISIVDTSGASSDSSELLFKTKPTNKPPVALFIPTPTIHMIEDNALLNAMNLTWYENNGLITDDHYNGYSGIHYEIDPWPGQNYIEGRIVKRNNCTYIDFYPLLPNQVPPGDQRFNLSIMDTGRDGIPDNPDDLATVVTIKVRMNGTNDRPIWKEFIDMTSNTKVPIAPAETYLDLLNQTVGAIEGRSYKFSLRGDDIDGDFITFTSPDERIAITHDGDAFKVRSIFEFTPTYEDAPLVSFDITMDDSNGGKRELTLVIPVIDVQVPPEFLTIAGRNFRSGTFEFVMEEESAFEFNVTAFSYERPETVVLKTNRSDRVTIERIDPGLFEWNVKVTSVNDDPQNGPIRFNLILEDKVHFTVVTDISVKVNNTPDMPILGTPAIEFYTDYDGNDQFEWGEALVSPEWGEPVRFVAHASDPDRDPLEYEWTFVNIVNNSRYFKCLGKEVIVRFMPSDGKLYDPEDEDYSVVLGVKDSFFDPVMAYSSIRIFSDGDNDNDGLPDIREKWFFDQLVRSVEFKDFDHKSPVDMDTYVFEEWKSKYRGQIHYSYYRLLTDQVMKDPLLLFDKNGDPDGDGFSNNDEIGFHIPPYDRETRTPYSLNMDFLDPLNPYAYPGTQWNLVKNGEPPEEHTPFWVYYMGGSVVFLLLFIGIGVVFIIRLNRKREREEDAEMDRLDGESRRSSQVVGSLYGSKYMDDEDFGPDQSTLDDLKIEKGGPVYEDGALRKGEIQLVPAPGFWDSVESESEVEPEIGDAYEELLAMEPESRATIQQLRDRIKKGRLAGDIKPEIYRELMGVLDQIEE